MSVGIVPMGGGGFIILSVLSGRPVGRGEVTSLFMFRLRGLIPV